MKIKVPRHGLFIICSLALAAGCARYDARKHLQNVAKNWCETIRASQVIPVYPLTQDVAVGDVFLVETTIASQAAEYEDRGFLPLDDFRVRLPYTNFQKIYFDGYWKDEFGSAPHVMPEFTNVVSGTNADYGTWTAVSAPRVAFPTYSFQAQSGFGLSAAFPVQGIPVALGFLRSDQVNGSVSITDARTFAGDQGELYSMLKEWAAKPEVRLILSETVQRSGPTPVYLRVISRVFLARAMDIYLQNARSQGGNAKAGMTEGISMTSANGSVNENYTNLLKTLNSQNGALTSPTSAGGAFTFVSASASSVGMSQSFDRLLTVGYLGFDVPVYKAGDLGVPVPTFEHLKGKLRMGSDIVGPLSLDQSQFKSDLMALEFLATSNPNRAMRLMALVAHSLGGPEYGKFLTSLKNSNTTNPSADDALSAMKLFKQSSINYVSLSGRQGPRYERFGEAFSQAFSESEKQPMK